MQCRLQSVTLIQILHLYIKEEQFVRPFPEFELTVYKYNKQAI